MITILMDSNKNLILSGRKPVYQGEYDIDTILFYIPKYYDGYDLSQFDAELEFSNASNIPSSRDLDQITSEKENYICFETKMDNELTDVDGTVTMHLTLSYNTAEHVLKTNEVTFKVTTTSDYYKYYVYCGVAEGQDTYTEEFIKAFQSVKKSSKNGTYTKEVGSGQYMFLAYPIKFGTTAYFKIAGFYVDAISCGTVNVTDPDGVNQDYYLYRTPQPSTGITTIIVE